MIITGKTESGFSYKIQKEQVEDYEFIELIGEVEESPTVLPKLLKRLLGKDQTEKLKEHLRTEDGFVPAAKMIEEFGEILNNPKLKNS